MNKEQGRVKESGLRCTVFKRNFETDFDVKTIAAKNFYKWVVNNFGYFGFSLN